jgi:hypothetical protein
MNMTRASVKDACPMISLSSWRTGRLIRPTSLASWSNRPITGIGGSMAYSMRAMACTWLTPRPSNHRRGGNAGMITSMRASWPLSFAGGGSRKGISIPSKNVPCGISDASERHWSGSKWIKGSRLGPSWRALRATHAVPKGCGTSARPRATVALLLPTSLSLSRATCVSCGVGKRQSGGWSVRCERTCRPSPR